MKLWNKIKLGTKFLLGGWEPALDYLLEFFNDYLGKENVAPNVAKVVETAKYVLDWLVKLTPYVPEKWRNEYDAISGVVADIIAVAKDGKLDSDEIVALVDSFKEAKKKWEED